MSDNNSPSSPQKRFGAFGGVFTPSILTIVGVILYLRMGWVVGNSGLAGTLLIVLLAHLISFSTGLSVSSIATNRTVGAGGAYYMISRSLGSSAGASIGIPLFLAQALSVTFYVVGFSDSLGQLVPGLDVRLAGMITLAVLTLISYISAGLVIRVQYLVMTAIGVSLVAFFAGGSSESVPEVSMWASGGASFSAVFAVFFPAVTGIMAGVSMSGDLKDPRKALPLGTLSAIGVGMAVYLAVPIWLSLNVEQSVLASRYDAMWVVARVPSLLYVGIWGATLSSALGSLLAAPRTLQALAVDRMVPRIFSQGQGPANEPRWGLLFTFLLALGGVAVGSLDVIAPVLTMFFLVTYGVTNLAFGLERWASSPSFRPSFRVPAWVGLMGAFACFYVMSVISLAAMSCAVLVCAGIYVLAKRRSLDATYGDARHGIWSALVLMALQRLRRARYHEVSWRPNLIVLAGNLAKRSYLLDVGSAVVQERGMVTYLHLLRGEISELAQKRREILRILERQFIDDYPNVLCRVDIVDDIYRGAVSSVMSQGLGTVEANTVIAGWLTKVDRAENYVKMLSSLLALDRSLLIVRFDPERGFGMGRQIDIWWRGMRSNGAMMLMLAFLLDSHDRFKEVSVRVITVVDTEEQKKAAEARLNTILSRSRFEAYGRVLLREGHRITDIMQAESAKADLVLLGLQLPMGGETAQHFLERYSSLLNGLPTTILVGSAPSFKGTAVLFDEED